MLRWRGLIVMGAVLPAVLPAQRAHPFQQVDEDSVLVGRVRDLCRPSLRTGRAGMLAVERAASTAVAAGVADSLLPAACARALLALDRQLAVPGNLMPLGTGWAEGAFPLLYERIRITEFGDREAVELLAAFALLFTERTTVASSHNRRVAVVSPEPSASLLLHAVSQGSAAPAVARACVSLMHALGDYAALRRCATRALSQGSDSTWHLLRLASADFAEGLHASGMRTFEAAVTAIRSPAEQEEVLWHLEPRPVGGGPLSARRGRSTDGERDRWRRLVPDSLLAVVRARYGQKGIRGMMNDEARLAHHFGSLAYAGGTFRDCGLFIEMAGVDGARRLPCHATLPPPLGTELIPVRARWYRLWEPRTGGLLSVVAALGQSDWRKGTNDSIPPTLTLSRRTAASGGWRDSTVQIVLPDSPGRQTIGWLLRLPDSDWVEEWQVSVTAGERRRGGASGVFRPRDAGSALQMSDLVVGSPHDGLVLPIGEEQIPFSATGRLERLAPITLYAQVHGLPVGEDLLLDIAVYDRRGASAQPSLKATSRLRAVEVLTALVRQVDLSRLDTGPVRLEVAVSDLGGRVLASRMIALELH